MNPAEEKDKKTNGAINDQKSVVANTANLSNNEDKHSLSANDLSGGNLDKIRDILFGQHMRTYEKRLIRLEERLAKDTADLREDLRKRFDNLEQYIKKEVDALNDRARTEERERADGVREVSRELKDTTRALEKRLTTLDDNLTKSQREFNQQLSDKSRALAEEIRQKYDELLHLVDREALELRSDKADRAVLASLFTEVAMRLNNEFKIPGGE